MTENQKRLMTACLANYEKKVKHLEEELRINKIIVESFKGTLKRNEIREFERWKSK
jgi:hypothetical protein